MSTATLSRPKRKKEVKRIELTPIIIAPMYALIVKRRDGKGRPRIEKILPKGDALLEQFELNAGRYADEEICELRRVYDTRLSTEPRDIIAPHPDHL